MALYHFSTANGDDSRSSVQAQNPATPWKTITKFNSFFASSSPGDSFLFNRGEVFPGAMIISRSGSNGSPITIGAFGTGAKPVITGLSDVTGWVATSNGRYEATVPGGLSTCNMVTFNNAFQRIGKYPKAGASQTQGEYYTFSSHTSNTITSSAIGGAPSFVGGELVKRDCHWILMRHPVTAQTGSVVTYTGSNYQRMDDGNGFFFQNHPNACTATGDWAYNSTSHKLTMHFGGGAPGSTIVKAATSDILVNVANRSYITFSSVVFSGSNSRTVNVANANNIILTLCELYNSGVNGIQADSSTHHISLLDSLIERTNNNAIFGGVSDDWIIQRNVINNTGMIAGMGQSNDGAYFGTSDLANNSLVENNTITNTGYVAINWNGCAGNSDNVIIRKNLIDGFCLVKDDGAGIYTGCVAGYVTHTTCYIQDNIVLNGIGAGNGAGGLTEYSQTHGIYMDDYSNNIQITGNTVSKCAGSGIYLHLTKNMEVNNNTTFDNKNEEMLFSAELPGGPIRNVNLDGNIFFNLTKDTSQKFFVMLIRSQLERISSLWGTWNNNYYCRPLNSEAQSFIVIQPSPSLVGTLQTWKDETTNKSIGRDSASKGTPVVITDPNKIRFEYNASNSSKVVSLGANYIDVKGNSYPGTITLGAYKSAVLIQTSGVVNQLPVANAGPDKAITLPTSTVVLSGSGSDSDGSITGYTWSKVSGPSTYTASSLTAAQLTLTNMAAGVYVFQLVVKDNAGASSAADPVTITVNAAPPVNAKPIANAGANQTITLPTSSVTLNGNQSTDSDGTVVGYTWSKVSGPVAGGGAISTPNAVSTNITGLVAGTYIYQLIVTDDDGASSTADQVTVTVIQSPPVPPVADAGPSRTITAPTATATLNGSGTDADGTISTYAWTKVSGPAQYNIATPAAATTAVNNLVVGTYVFQLVVTDNQGNLSAPDQVTVTVNSAANQAPTANAGVDQNIVLPSSATLSGSGSDPDGTITKYAWAQISGPNSATLGTPNAAATTASNLAVGSYIFELTVTDNGNATGKDRITVNVTAANQKPIANAGVNQTITLPTASVLLDGRGSTDPDGTIASYSWTKVSGPSGSTLSSSTSATPTLSGLTQGTFIYQLVVTDNLGLASVADQIQITVNGTVVVTSPTVQAATGSVIHSTLPTFFTTVSLVATKGTGTLQTFAWTQVSGPATTTTFDTPSGNIPATANQSVTLSTVVRNLVVGTYVFRLTVTDSNGKTGNNTFTLTITAPTGTVIEAETSAFKSATKTNITDGGAGQALFFSASGKWAGGYALNIPASGVYRLSFRVSALDPGAAFRIEQGIFGGAVIGTRTVPDTNGVNNWTTVTVDIALPKGRTLVSSQPNAVYLTLRSTSAVPFSINWLSYIKL